MCDYSGKLVAWLDRELGDDEMAELKRHIGVCNECQSRIETYRQVSATFDGYCDAVLLAKTRKRRLPRWVPVLTTAAAVAIAATLVFVLLRPRVEPPAIPPSVQVQAPPPTIVVEKAPAPAPGKVVVHRPRATAASVPRQTANWQPAERAIQISIPAESMFPPGAVPEGVNFVADLSIAADGSAEQMRLRPRLIEVQRRQP
jgi:putative zinc finger protein